MLEKRTLALLSLGHLSFAVLGTTQVRAQEDATAEATWGPRFHAAFVAAFPEAAPPIAATLVLGDQVVATRVAGVYQGATVDERTPFDIGEIARELTAVLTLRLVAAGKLRLEHRIADHFERVPAAWQALDVRRLLTQTSGLPVEPSLLAKEWEDRDRCVAAFLRHEPAATAGRAPVESDTDWQLLACLIEAVSVAPFDKIIAEHLFEPAGMRTAQVRAPSYRERGAGGVRCSLRDLRSYCIALQRERLISSSEAAALVGDDKEALSPLGRVQRTRHGDVRGYEHATSHAYVLRRVAPKVIVIALSAQDGAVDAFARALHAEERAGVALDDVAGRYRLGPTDWFDLATSGSAIDVRAVGTEATARLLFGLPHHPEWPQMLKEFEAHAHLHLKPLLKRDASSLARCFDARAPADAAARALALMEDLVARHGAPGKVTVLGTRTMGAVTTTVRVTFGSTPVNLRLQWHAYNLSAAEPQPTRAKAASWAAPPRVVSHQS
jgi:CubicO group peptidase (beta-lactamase class C family)